ncbi:MAG TPA: carbon-nitrogen hydrolase family protein [Candidatus Acidoferrum sp.]|nr:carbon-nitrogen hydrolase family protein [Candidatus Acidoferrum sp.]
MSIVIALAQLRSTDDKPANLAKIASFAESAAKAGARLVVFPEAAMHDFVSPTTPLAPVAETVDGPFVTRLRELARAHRISILAGMFETSPYPNRVYNTLVYVDERGELGGTYRKIHLYDALGFVESDRIVPGEGTTLAFTCDGIRFGAMTCYDLRFPELARHLVVDERAEVLLLPTAWLHGLLKEDHLRTLIRARAIENTVYFCAADQVLGAYSGNSAVVDPMGVVVASAGETEGLVLHTLSPERVAAVREKLPSIANRRPEVYERWESDARVPS